MLLLRTVYSQFRQIMMLERFVHGMPRIPVSSLVSVRAAGGVRALCLIVLWQAGGKPVRLAVAAAAAAAAGGSGAAAGLRAAADGGRPRSSPAHSQPPLLPAGRHCGAPGGGAGSPTQSTQTYIQTGSPAPATYSCRPTPAPQPHRPPTGPPGTCWSDPTDERR